MKITGRLLILFFATTLFSSCANYVRALHSQIDRGERAKQGRAAQSPQRYQDPYHRYSRDGDKRPINNPKTLGGYPVKQSNGVPPSVSRNYGKKRYTAEDLKDNSSDGSLWSGKNSESFLFVTNNIKKRGDIVIIDVLSKLKDDIQEELKRAYPDPVRKSAKNDEDKKEETKEEPQTAQNSPNEKENDKKVHDKISTQVVDSINKDYLMLRGRKEVIFKKAKRYIEVQALVSRRDITDNDTVASDRILEPKIRVLRY